jgi:hypothetical protein
LRRVCALLPWLALAAAVADWALLKSGRLSHSPWVLTALVGMALAGLLARAAAVLVEAVRGRRPPVGAAGELLLVLGVLASLLGGLANWSLGLQGFVVLYEGEAVPLHEGGHLQHFEAGPLARLEEMEFVLELGEVELVPLGEGLFYPESRILVRQAGAAPVEAALSTRTSARAGSLRFFQGAFGFAPRIVLLEEGKAVFDKVVPFTTERRGPTGVAFEGSFRIEERGLDFRGRVDLASLDEGMRGHATLELSLSRNGESPGRGRLLPGRFAELGDGLEVGFAGLSKWSEIDIARRDYGRAIVGGALLAAVGGLVWALGAWRGR